VELEFGLFIHLEGLSRKTQRLAKVTAQSALKPGKPQCACALAQAFETEGCKTLAETESRGSNHGRMEKRQHPDPGGQKIVDWCFAKAWASLTQGAL
jgi:hypothetical protein